ncbi:hypothetical protein DYB34_014259, partial [Aphanomyces astaci]
AEVGNEGITYGLLTTVSNLPLVFGPVVANVIFGQFKVDNVYIEADSADARTQVAYTYLIYYSTTIFACVWVVLMPSQKAHVHELKVTGGKSPVIGGLVLFGCTAAMLWSVVVGILGVFQSTNCLVIAGGSGFIVLCTCFGVGFTTTTFNDAWDVLPRGYNNLHAFSGGLASVVANTTAVESDFSILKLELEEFRSCMMHLSLEGIFQAKQRRLLMSLLH